MMATPFVPEIRLHLADDVFALWERIEATVGPPESPLPFWAFAWPGGQALARYVLDRPALVRGRRVLDVGSGSGLVAIAAAKAGAAAVTASDVVPFAIAAIALNAQANGVVVAGLLEDVLAGDGVDAEVVLAADLFYEQSLAERVVPFLERARARSATVLVGDPGRAYLPRSRFEVVASYEVPVMRALEDAAVKPSMVWRPAAG
jgi:predicted nicotinamide N-methyase